MNSSGALGYIRNDCLEPLRQISGETLKTIWEDARNQNRVFPPAMTCYLMQIICEKLDYCQTQQSQIRLTRRDIYPNNITISHQGDIRVNCEHSQHDGSINIFNNLEYISPEQMIGYPIDQCSEVYACGVIFYELLSGRNLYENLSKLEILEKTKQGIFIPPSKFNLDVCVRLDEIAMKALARDPSKRYQNSKLFAQDLKLYLFNSASKFTKKDLQQYLETYYPTQVIKPIDNNLSKSTLGVLSLGPTLSQKSDVLNITSDFQIPFEHPVDLHEDTLQGNEQTLNSKNQKLTQKILSKGIILAIALIINLVIVFFATHSYYEYFLPKGQLHIRITPHTAELYLNSKFIAKNSPVDIKELEAKTYILAAKAPGFHKLVRPIKIRAGEKQTVTLKLAPIPGKR